MNAFRTDQWRVQMFQYQHDRSEQPLLRRTPDEERKRIKRAKIHREVIVKRLIQQGLTRFEAEEQYDMGLR